MQKKIEKSLRFTLIIWAVYALGEGIIFLFNIRLGSVQALWPISALGYSKLVEKILGSVFLLISALIFLALRDLNKYKQLITLSGIWAAFHGGLLLFFGLTEDYSIVFLNAPSLHVWLPFYNYYLICEAIILFAYSGIVYIWSRKDS